MIQVFSIRITMLYFKANLHMFKFSFNTCRAILILFQIVFNMSTITIVNGLSTTPDSNKNVKADNEVISFDRHGPSPVYPAGGDFGNGAIDLGGLLVDEALYFKKIWNIEYGGSNDLGASFYEPTSIPMGFHLLGHYCKPNAISLFASVLMAKDATGDPLHGALKSPIDYTLIWNSKDLKVSQSEFGYIWYPVPPNGYKAVGHIVTTSPKKPSLDKVKCVRSDLTDLIEVDTWIWGLKVLGISLIDVYTSKPVTKGLSVPTGTFLAQYPGSLLHKLACLKMGKNNSYSAMPNSLQIRTMIKAYSPWVYFHPDEQYFPSSVLWVFQNGVELHQKGQIPRPVLNDGDNLPNYGSVDDYFLDLPSDELNKEFVKKGFLADAVAYIHVKSALGGIYTDLAIWLYYPFNGGGLFQLGPFTINLGKIGEHVSDWEHMTLRIDNFRGSLKAIYLSQHAKGKWVTPQEFECMNGTRPVVYASLHGHTHYNTPTYHIHTTVEIDSSDKNMLNDEYNSYSRKSPITKGDKFVGFGAMDKAAKSDNVMDIASSYNVVYVDYNKALGIEPWLNYTGRWGPKITYGFTKEVIKITSNLPDKVKELAIKVLHKILPAEVFGEEGPQGPKMKDSWIGDERT